VDVFDLDRTLVADYCSGVSVLTSKFISATTSSSRREQPSTVLALAFKIPQGKGGVAVAYGPEDSLLSNVADLFPTLSGKTPQFRSPFHICNCATVDRSLPTALPLCFIESVRCHVPVTEITLQRFFDLPDGKFPLPALLPVHIFRL